MILRILGSLLTLLVLVIGCQRKAEPPPSSKSETPTTSVQQPLMQPAGSMLYPVQDSLGHHGFMDSLGQKIVASQFESADFMWDGMSRVRLNGQWGYVDNMGRMVIQPQFEKARRFSEGMAAVRVKGKYGYVDRGGNMIVPPQYSKLAQAFSDGLAAVPDSAKKFGFIDKTGKLVIPHKFDNVHPFAEGMAAASIGDKWGFIDNHGNWAIEPKFVWADKFVNGQSVVRIGLQPNVDYAMVNRKGDVVFRAQVTYLKTPSDGLTRFALNDKTGFMDYTGKIVIPATFDAAFDFSEGLAAVRVGNGWGYIDTAGKLLINVEHNFGDAFTHGIARVAWPNGNWGYINRMGEKLWESNLRGGTSIPAGGADGDDE